ncbi:MAG: 23S rRNA (guanosine(2251)-2'-O)-methyltransferase RlmB [Bacteroidetes bacterium]|nr:23S rRNA (guanosine(2251)-2'-O)-methyltransferase RlmB [Bacteroidota bacterium]
MEENQIVYGRNPVEEILQKTPEKVEKVYIKDSAGGGLSKIISLASENRIPLQRVPGKKLFDLAGPVNDQGVVAQVSMVTYIELEDWLLSVQLTQNPVVLVMDELEDVANFGAILRTAAAAGVHAVIVPKHRQAPVNAAVFKTSAGTAGRIPIIRVTNTNQAILKLKDVGFWVAGLDQHADTSLWQQDFTMPLVVIIGNEGKGIRKKTLDHCDFTLSLPMYNDVESLNASVSAALICYEIVRQRQKL